MSADISALGGLNPVEPLDMEGYAEAKEYPQIPKKGVYSVKAPESFPSTAFSRSQAGALTAQIDPTIVGPTNEGYQLRYTKVSAKTWQRAGKTVSQLGDYLRAVGVRGRFADEQAQADAVESTANQVYQVEVDWRAYNTVTKFKLEGMENFPKDEAGNHLPFCIDPSAKDENGNPYRLRAQASISRFIPASA